MVTLESLLRDEEGYEVGEEPGSSNYAPGTPYRFVRTAAIQREPLLPLSAGSAVESLARPLSSSPLEVGDLLLVKDSNVGQVCLVDEVTAGAWFSSGIVRMRPQVDRLWLLGVLSSRHFRQQLLNGTSPGATIRHSGALFKECLVPDPLLSASFTKIRNATERLVDIETTIRTRHRDMLRSIETLLGVGVGVGVGAGVGAEGDGWKTTFRDLTSARARLDAGPHSSTVREYIRQCARLGSTSLSTLGVVSRRGPNLAESVVGHLLYSTTPRSNWYRLIRPTSITAEGVLSEFEYLGTALDLPTVNVGEIVFGTEATLRSTVICEALDRCTTNFHGTILSWPSADLIDVVWLRCMLEYQRQAGILADLSVGGQGGHLSPEYFDTIVFPLLARSEREDISSFYYSDDDECPGIWQLEKERRALRGELDLLTDAAYGV